MHKELGLSLAAREVSDMLSVVAHAVCLSERLSKSPHSGSVRGCSRWCHREKKYGYRKSSAMAPLGLCCVLFTKIE